MKSSSLYFCLNLVLPLTLATPDSQSLVVSLTSGTFRGIASGSSNATEKWLGIPFAEPPVGNLRFKAPVPTVRTSKTVQDASQFGNACPQEPSATLGAPMGEDCLTLNVNLNLFRARRIINTPCQVWRPTGTTSKDKLPVLVWFYVRTLSSIL